MKIEMQMTERDKKLLVFLAIFVIVVGCGYWGIRPIINDILDINEEIEEQENDAYMNSIKITELPVYEMDNEEYEEEILAARTHFYPMMTSNEVDKLMTGMALSYNLYSYDLAIYISEGVANTEAYQYSEKYAEDMSYEYEEDDDFSTDLDSLDSLFGSDDDYEYDGSDEFTGIYEVVVTMRLGGSIEDLQRFIDDFSINDKEVLVNSYVWTEVESMEYNEEIEDYELTTELQLNIEISIFMCEE